MYWRKNWAIWVFIEMYKEHTPVLLKETIEYLDPKSGDIVLDGTLGAGGHAKEICKLIGEGGILIGIDQDKKALEIAEAELKNAPCEKFFFNGNFRDLDKFVKQAGVKGTNKALFDLGMSSMEIDSPAGEIGRGFSFQKNEPLTMSYKAEILDDDLTARKIVNQWNEREIADVIYKYGEERFSRRIAKGIVEGRRKRKIETTQDLVKIIQNSVPKFYCRGRIHCATRTFQALRIAVNDELNALREGIEKAWDFLLPGSRMAVISFHSLEDRIVKNFFKLKHKKEGLILTKKPVVASREEIKNNPRARSAKLRVIFKNNESR